MSGEQTKENEFEGFLAKRDRFLVLEGIRHTLSQKVHKWEEPAEGYFFIFDEEAVLRYTYLARSNSYVDILDESIGYTLTRMLQDYEEWVCNIDGEGNTETDKETKNHIDSGNITNNDIRQALINLDIQFIEQEGGMDILNQYGIIEYQYWFSSQEYLDPYFQTKKGFYNMLEEIKQFIEEGKW